MADGKGDVQLSWQTVASAVSVVGLLAFAQYSVFQTQFAGMERTIETNRIQVEQLKTGLDKYITLKEHDAYSSGVKEQLNELRSRATVLEAALAKAAREPVEKETFNAVSKATDDRVTLLQNSINDINRQIAAVVFGLDGSTKKSPPPSP